MGWEGKGGMEVIRSGKSEGGLVKEEEAVEYFGVEGCKSLNVISTICDLQYVV